MKSKEEPIYPVYDEPLPDDEIERRSIEWDMEQYEDTKEGDRFLRTIENAEKFTKEHDKNGGLSSEQLHYLVNISQLDVYEALMVMYNIAYQRGYYSARQEGERRE